MHNDTQANLSTISAKSFQLRLSVVSSANVSTDYELLDAARIYAVLVLHVYGTVYLAWLPKTLV